MLIDFNKEGSEREGERKEREEKRRKTSIGCLSYVPQPGTEPTT